MAAAAARFLERSGNYAGPRMTMTSRYSADATGLAPLAYLRSRDGFRVVAQGRWAKI